MPILDMMISDTLSGIFTVTFLEYKFIYSLLFLTDLVKLLLRTLLIGIHSGLIFVLMNLIFSSK